MSVTKTLGPLHFEDLEPHRFEDLVRELVYDLKDWQTIEATGRSGSDDGIDIRAYERVSVVERDADESEEGNDDELVHPMDGNLWMIQCKRESAIGPTKVKEIIADGAIADSPPYGYILAAPANFSKKSHDLFREELRKRGVMEFYLWGRAALEDMLHLPKNDRVLFTFFGISLVTRRRARATDIRAVVSRKNKLMRIVGDEPSHDPILVRDLNDRHYPDSSRYKDFETRPRWHAYGVVDLDPRGLVLSVQEHFAYWNRETGEWDMAEALNLMRRHEDDEHERQRADRELRERIEAFWRFIPHAHQATFVSHGLIQFEDIAVIDDKGDGEFKFPHIFVDFHATKGPFAGFYRYLRINEYRRGSLEGLKRINFFPGTFDAPRIGKVHDTKLKLPSRVSSMLFAGNRSTNTLYDVEGRLDFLAVADVIAIEETDGRANKSGEPTLIQITHRRVVPGAAFLKSVIDDPGLSHQVRVQIGREVTENDQVQIIEFKVTYLWAIEKAGAEVGGM
jgi:hypothetical protein